MVSQANLVVLGNSKLASLVIISNKEKAIAKLLLFAEGRVVRDIGV